MKDIKKFILPAVMALFAGRAAAQSSYAVNWIDVTNASVSSGVLTKTTSATGWNAGAWGSNILAPSTDGWIQFTMSSSSTQRTIMIGFTTNSIFGSSNFVGSTYIASAGQVTAYEGTTGTASGSITNGDVIRISREGTQLKYYKNGNVFRTVTIDATQQLHIMAIIDILSGTTPAVTASFDSQLNLRASITGAGGTASDGAISLATASFGGNSPYTYSWSSGETTSSISGKAVGSYTATVTDAAARTASKTFSVGYKVNWLEQVGISVSGSVLTKTAANGWGTGGGNSANVLPASTDGWVEFPVSPESSYVFGFATNGPFNYTDFVAALNISNVPSSTFGTYEAGTATSFTTWQTGDIFRISREGSSIKYYRNGIVFRTVTTDPTLELKIKTAIYYNASNSPLVITASFDARLALQPTVSGSGASANTGSISLSTAGGISPYTYSWSGGETTSSISGKSNGAYTATVTDAEGRTRTQTFDLAFKSYWATLTGMSSSGGVVTKTAANGWNTGGALSSNVLAANTDGWVEFVAGTGNTYEIGFSIDPSFSYSDFTNAITISNINGLFNTYESSTATQFGTWQAGDVFKVSREGSSVKYYRNGTVFRTVTVSAVYELRVKAAMYYNGTSCPPMTQSFDTELSALATVKDVGTTADDGAVTLTAASGTAPYTYSWSSGETTASITGKPVGSYSITITDAESRSHTFGYDIGSTSNWINQTGVTDNMGVLTKTAANGWGTGGANSYSTLAASTDGWIEFTVNGGTNAFAIGFANSPTFFNYNSFTNGLSLDATSGLVNSYEGSTGTSLGSFQTGDIFRVSREGSSVKYYRNGVVLRTVTVTPTQALSYKASINFGTTPAVTSSFEVCEMKVIQDAWSFQYKYDGRRRMIAKKVPGADWVYMVYDPRDRLVLTQDGNQRAAYYWAFTKYDALNRPILTGIMDTTLALTQAQMQAVVDNFYSASSPVWGETSGTTVHGYTNVSYPQESDPNDYLTVTYYDDYAFKNIVYDSGRFTFSASELPGYQATNYFKQLKGKITGTKTKVLDGGVLGGSTWMLSVNYYDPYYRVIQTASENYKSGIDRTTNVYDFVNKVLRTKTTHGVNNVTWTDRKAVSVVGNKLICEAAGFGNSGAASVQQLATGQDGCMEFYASEKNTSRMLGLSAQDLDANYTSVDYQWYLTNSSTLQIYEKSTFRGGFGSYVPGDVLKIARTGTTIKYYQNNVLKYTSTVPSTTALMVDASLASQAIATLANVRSTFSTSSSSVTRRFDYDHMGRLVNIWHRVDSNPEVQLVSNQYNEIGQLVDKKLHVTGSGFRQSIDYRYNIRGWLTSSNGSDLQHPSAINDDTNDLFGFNLIYEQNNVSLLNMPQYNGNISAMTWSANQNLSKVGQLGYTYAYDPLNRITAASYQKYVTSWAAATSYSEGGYSYDLNGNINALTRNDSTGAVLDGLTYNYGLGAASSNKLLGVDDSGNKNAGFTDGNTGYDYTYDQNGNMLTDLNKAISTNITYNFHNLPELVTRGTGNTLQYIYDAGGSKLAQVVTYGTAQEQTDYSGEYQYKNDALQQVTHDEGRVVYNKRKDVYINDGDNTTNVTATNATVATLTQNSNQTYLKITSTSTTVRSGILPVGGTFVVSAGDTYLIRAKGYRGSNAVYVTTKGNGTDITWPGATLPAGAAAEAWVEETITIPVGTTQLTAGLNWANVTNGDIFYVNDFQIIKLTTGTPEYQYNLKDHLGNVRMTFTTKVCRDTSLATLEKKNAAKEQGEFLNYTEAVVVNSTLFDHTHLVTPADTSFYSTRLTGKGTTDSIGLAKSLSVMPGDTLNIEVYAKYLDPTSSNWTPALASFIASIASGGGAPAGTIIDGGYPGSLGNNAFPFAGIMNYAHADNSVPKAYLNYLIFDRNYVYRDGGFRQVSSAAKEDGQDVAHEHLYFSNITIKEPGYVYIWLSNENATPVEVFFDDLKVTHGKSAIVQEDDYYPFGLAFNSYSRESSTENDFLYNGKEKQNALGLNWLDYGARMYMAEIGRWGVIDPLAENFLSLSPYTYALNNPITFVDIEGLLPGDPRYTGSGNVVIIIADNPNDFWDTSTLDNTKWDYGVFKTVSEARQWMDDTYGKNGVGVNNLVFRTHGGVGEDEFDSGIALGLNSPNEDWLEARDFDDNANNKNAADIIAIASYLKENGNMLFTACGISQKGTALANSIFQAINGSKRSLTVYTNGTSTKLAWSRNDKIKVNHQLNDKERNFYKPWYATTGAGSSAMKSIPGLGNNGFIFFPNSSSSLSPAPRNKKKKDADRAATKKWGGG